MPDKEKSGNQLREALVKTLAESPLLRMLGQAGKFSSELRELLNEATLLDVKQGETLIREGAKCDGFFILVQGRLEVLKGDKLIGAIIQPGEVFGEVGLLGDGHRTATVRAATEAQCFKSGAGLGKRSSDKDNALFVQAMQHALAQVMLTRMNSINTEVAELRGRLKRRDREIAELKKQNSFLDERVSGLLKERNEGFRGPRKARPNQDD